MTILVTGSAGFIGHATVRRLLQRGESVVGVDCRTPYYDRALKEARIADLRSLDAAFTDLCVSFADADALNSALAPFNITAIIHLGAQPGVRWSIDHPQDYGTHNLVGQLNMLELARRLQVPMVYASSSSVYGANTNLPFAVEDRTDRPISLYAATKKAAELMSETYAHLYRIPLTGLRFFTVYGPWGRPDMSVWQFTAACLEGRSVTIYNHGAMRRDFTFIDDIVAGVIACHDCPPADDGAPKPGGSMAPHAVYNIGNNKSEPLERLIAVIEQACGRPLRRRYGSLQPGDMVDTYADISLIARDHGFAPTTPIDTGIPAFVQWYRTYQQPNICHQQFPDDK
jgi:UDP-glucuronate 4-epimerase